MSDNDSDSDNESVFLKAIRNEDERRVEALLRKGICLKKIGGGRAIACPLELAINQENLGIVRILLHHGACVSAKIRTFNRTALRYAVITRQRSLLLELLRHRVDWKSRDEKGASVLHMVFELGPIDFERTSNGMLRRCGGHGASSSSKRSWLVERKIIEVLRIFVALKVDVNARDDRGHTALHLALGEGMVRVAEYLLAQGANVNVCDHNGNSPIHLLIEDELRSSRRQNGVRPIKNNEAIIDWLSSRGAKVNLVNGQGHSPIQLAIEHRLKGILLVLLDYVDVNYVNGRGETWLHAFLRVNDYSARWRESLSSAELDDIVDDLVDMGVPVDLADCYGSTALHVAALQRKSRAVRKMLERFTNVSACDGLGRTVLHLIADRCLDEAGNYIEGYDEVARALIAKGADLSRPTKEGMTPVQLAAKQRHLRLLWLFKEHGAELARQRTGGGETLLHLVAKKRAAPSDGVADKMSVEMLISQGCEVDARCQSGRSPLHVAALYGNCRVLASLLKHGARVDCREELAGRTPLHLAASAEAVEILAMAGADLDATDAHGLTALHLAALKGEATLAERLLELGAEPRCRDRSRHRLTPLHLAAQRGDERLTELLLRRLSALGLDGVDAAAEVTGATPLHVAAERGSLGIVDLLVELGGADLERRDARDRSTCLHVAVRAGNLELVRWLLERAEPTAEVNARQAFGETPLHVAVKYFRAGDEGVGVARTLLRAAARVDLLDSSGRTPLQCAVEYDCSEAVDLLLQFGADLNDVFARDLFAKLTDNCDMACHLIEHVVKLEALQLPPIAAQFKSSIDKRTRQFERLRDKCRREVDRLKARLIDERYSVYDLLHMKPERRYVFMCNAAFSPASLEDEFPKYCGYIWTSYHEARRRRILLRNALDAWYLLVEIDLPNICVDRILGFLDNDALTSITEAAQAIELEEIC